MKLIVKDTEELDSLKKWKKKNHKANWKDFSGSEAYQELKQRLLEEQKNLCCYCEVALKANRETHIEHFKPRDSSPKEMFNIQNLFACCQHNDCCGHEKGGSYFDQLISPLQKDCESYFTYTRTGRIIALDEKNVFVEKTINLLGLNSKRLRDQRKSILDMLDYKEVTVDYLEQALENCIEWHNGFFTVIKHLVAQQSS